MNGVGKNSFMMMFIVALATIPVGFRPACDTPFTTLYYYAGHPRIALQHDVCGRDVFLLQLQATVIVARCLAPCRALISRQVTCMI